MYIRVAWLEDVGSIGGGGDDEKLEALFFR